MSFIGLSNIALDNSFTACTRIGSSVKSNITCDGGSCGVTNIRRSRFDQRLSGYTPLYYGVGADGLEHYWPLSGGSGEHPVSSTPTEYLISNPRMSWLAAARSDDGDNRVAKAARSVKLVWAGGSYYLYPLSGGTAKQRTQWRNTIRRGPLGRERAIVMGLAFPTPRGSMGRELGLISLRQLRIAVVVAKYFILIVGKRAPCPLDLAK